ncbi:MAG: hypothetical protein EXS31_17505 [Pedosphaera sp.]|nr:hypothetical protein [Pedosphaera sp.]
MAAPQAPVTLTPAQIEELATRLSDFRHNINNNLSLVVAAVELIRRKPDLVERMSARIMEQPTKILAEVKTFSDFLEARLNIVRE